MAWQDRPYYRDPRPAGNPLMWLLTGSVSLGTWFGINVRLHASMLILVVLVLLFPNQMGGSDNAITFSLILFGIVLLHEFGHCFASRLVGGNPQEIILYPLGGLAFADAPQRPGATFVTVSGGPLVNVILCLITGTMLYYHNGASIPWNLLGQFPPLPTDWLYYYAWWVFTISYALLLFNLWPIFPLDGGQMLQAILWWRMGYYRSMKFACITGIIGAVVMAAVGLVDRHLILFFVAISGFSTCFGMYQSIKAAGPYEEPSDYSTSLFSTGRKRRKLGRWALRWARRQLRRDEAEQAKIDIILAKVSAHGMHSLTWWEKRTLRKATEHQRQRDMEMSRSRHD